MTALPTCIGSGKTVQIAVLPREMNVYVTEITKGEKWKCYKMRLLI